jgi:hypothetical protein
MHCDSCCSASWRWWNEAFPTRISACLRPVRPASIATLGCLPCASLTLQTRRRKNPQTHSGPRKQPGVWVRSPTEMSNSPAVDRDGRDCFRAFALSWEHSGRRLRAKAKGHVCFKRANARLSSGSSARSGQASGCREAHHSNSYPNMTRTRSRSLSLVNPKASPT